MDQEPEPGRLLPDFVENTIVDSYLMRNLQDRLTLTLGFTRLLQSMMATIGSLLERANRETSSSCSKDAPRALEDEDDDSEDHLLMQTELTLRTSPWHSLLHELREALEQQTKAALQRNVQWLQRRLHHRCVDSQRGQLLGLLRHDPGDLMALLACAAAELEDVDAGSTVACTTWCAEWWSRLEAFLPIHPGSLFADGQPVLRDDPMPVAFMKPLPENDVDDGSEAAPSPDGAPRGPPPPVPVWMQHMDSVPDDELDAIASQCEREQRLREQEAHEQEEAEFDAYNVELLRQHEAFVYHMWEDRAMHDEMHRPKRQRGLHLEATWSRPSGDTRLGHVHIPLKVLQDGGVRLKLNLYSGEALGTGSCGTSTLPATMMDPVPSQGGSGGAATVSKGSGWNNVSLGGEQLSNLYLNWRAGQVSAQQIQEDFGPEVLEALHAEHLLYMNGEQFFRATKCEREQEGARLVWRHC